MKLKFALLLLPLIMTSCKTTNQNVNRRHGERTIVDEGILAPESQPISSSRGEEQAVTVEEIASAPVIDLGVPAPGPEIMVPEIGSLCKSPVSFNCLGLITSTIVDVRTSLEMGKAIKKYGRSITVEDHACNYYNNRYTYLKNISYFVDAVVYWVEKDQGISYQAVSPNFIFGAGCNLDLDFKNPYQTELLSTQKWDGTSTLQNLGYNYGTGFTISPNFAVDRLKAEKITQAIHSCKWAIRPIIYAFPDGVVYQFVNAKTYDIYSYNQVKDMGCILSPALTEAAEKTAAKCGASIVNPDPIQRQTLTELGLLPAAPTRKIINMDWIAKLEVNGKPVVKSSLSCTFASRNRILQFTDGFAFIDDYCSNVNIYTNENVKSAGCTIPVL